MFPSRRTQPRLAAEYAAARELRRQGLPLKQIANRVGASVSSVRVWVRDIQLTAEQREANLRRAGQLRGQRWREANRRKRAGYQERGRARARLGDPLHQAGCMLYWAEGSKSRNVVHFANSDLAMLQFFKHFAETCFDLTAERFTFHFNAYTTNGISLPEIERYWRTGLGLPRCSARKHQVNHYPTSSSGQRRDRLPFGVCSLKITKSTEILQHIYGAIQEYGGFEEPRWLDGPPRKTRSGSGRAS